jgi:hypothetical protein
MSSSGRVSLKDIQGMLAQCATGHTIVRKKHHYWVSFNGATFQGLPTGEHGERNPEIQIGIIRHMIRQLGIDMECAKKHLQVLR